MKRLYRSRTNRKLCGILGGLAEYFGLDATWLRLGFAILVIFTALFPFTLVYFVSYFIIPEEGVSRTSETDGTKK